MISSRFSSETPRMHSLKQTIHRSSSSSQGSDTAAIVAISFISTRLFVGALQSLQKDEARNPQREGADVFLNLLAFIDLPRQPVQCLIGQLVRNKRPATFEEFDQYAAQLFILLARHLRIGVQFGQETREGLRRQFPFFS